MSIHGPAFWSRSWYTAAAALLAMLLVSSCTEHSALPTWPAIDPDNTPGDWQRIYPIITNENLNAAWGMDADDMWIVGNRGTILHYDGRAVRPMEPMTTRDLVAIDGCARDEVWAVSRGGETLRWDGRRWSIVQIPGSRLETVLCLAPDNIYVGGRRIGGEQEPAVWHYDGHRWIFMPLVQDVPHSSVRNIWHPGPEFPVMAATDRSMFWLDGGAWHQTAAVVRLLDAEQDLVLAEDPHSFLVATVYRLTAGGSLVQECGQLSIGWLRNFIASSRLFLFGHSGRIWSLDDCRRKEVWRSPFSISDLAVPILPGANGAHVFAVGRESGLARLTWQPDHSMSADILLPEADNRRVRNLIGNGTDLHFLDYDGMLYRKSSSGWHRLETPFSARGIRMLPTGAVVIVGLWTRIVVLISKDTWHELAQFDGYLDPSHFWIDEQLRPRALYHSWSDERFELWGLDGADWTLLVDLSEEMQSDDIRPRRLAGFGPDDLYILCRDSHRDLLLHYDGHNLRQLFADDDLRVGMMEAGLFTQRLYLEGSMAHTGEFSGYLKDGALTVLDCRRGWDSLIEVSEDLVFCQTGTRIYQLGSEGWIGRAGPAGRRYDRIWGHLDQGLFVVSDWYEIFHSDLPRGTR